MSLLVRDALRRRGVVGLTPKMKMRIRSSFVVLLFASLSSLANAQTRPTFGSSSREKEWWEAERADPEDLLRPPPENARLRAGVASGITVGGAPHYPGGGGLSLELALGAQFSRRLGVYVQGSIATILLSSVASVHGIVEYNVARAFSVGTGIGYSGMSTFTGMCGGDGTECPDQWDGPTVPLVLGFDFFGEDAWRYYFDRRRVMRLQLMIAGGVDSRTKVQGGHVGLSLGVAWK